MEQQSVSMAGGVRTEEVVRSGISQFSDGPGKSVSDHGVSSNQPILRSRVSRWQVKNRRQLILFITKSLVVNVKRKRRADLEERQIKEKL